MNAMVASIISAMTKRPEFIDAIKEKIVCVRTADFLS